MLIFIGMDDTDIVDSRGTGRLARAIAAQLSGEFTLHGVTRHQLLVDLRIPYTSHNSSAALILESAHRVSLIDLFDSVREMMFEDYLPGSDPGLCVAQAVPNEITRFGLLAQQELVTQVEARELAAQHGLLLAGLGGSQDGVIGALAAVGLAASGEDGRYLLLGNLRDLSGLQPLEAVLAGGVKAVQTLDGDPVQTGLVLADKLRPARRGGIPIQFVEWQQEYWAPLKLN